jgi:predicted kinase
MMPSRKLPTLLILTGLPCTGKTYLGMQIANHLGYLILQKDGIKECLFSTLGWSNREWSRKLGGASYDLMYYLTDLQLAAGGSLILEANFYPEFHASRFQELLARHPCRLIQLLLTAEPQVLYKRFVQRWESGVRHPGHVDDMTYDEIHTILQNAPQSPLELPGAFLNLDTTDFTTMDIPGVLSWLDSTLEE